MPISKRFRCLQVTTICLILGGCAMVLPPPREVAEQKSVTREKSPDINMELTLATITADNVLDELRQNFDLPALHNAEVRHHEQWYRDHPEAVSHLFDQARWNLPYISREVIKRGIPAEIALLPAIESGFDATARSPTGAAGLWQFTAATASDVGLHVGTWLDQRNHLEASTEAALTYLLQLNRSFKGNWLLALAAYNAGEWRIKTLLHKNRLRGQPGDYRRLNFPSETRHFVPKLIALSNVVKNPGRFKVSLPVIENRLQYVVKKSERRIDHRQVARLCGIGQDVITQLNAEHTKGVTPPQGPHRVRAPSGCAGNLDLSAIPSLPQFRAEDRNYIVRTGDNLWGIAHRHGLTLNALLKENPGIDTTLVPGQRIRISSSPVKTTEKPKVVIHRIRRGETLSHVAALYHVSIRSLAEWNKIGTNSTLRLGQIIRIYP